MPADSPATGEWWLQDDAEDVIIYIEPQGSVLAVNRAGELRTWSPEVFPLRHTFMRDEPLDPGNTLDVAYARRMAEWNVVEIRASYQLNRQDNEVHHWLSVAYLYLILWYNPQHELHCDFELHAQILHTADAFGASPMLDHRVISESEQPLGSVYFRGAQALSDNAVALLTNLEFFSLGAAAIEVGDGPAIIRIPAQIQRDDPDLTYLTIQGIQPSSFVIETVFEASRHVDPQILMQALAEPYRSLLRDRLDHPPGPVVEAPSLWDRLEDDHADE